ncbi:uncharacterized protein BDV17DRAFT_167184 [Aspergillus undulatus]|uniref:uncharacterized protein n=1 Tax=Aspergillus undulatus TaxID=1810928 RepID=UPI003CCD9B9A
MSTAATSTSPTTTAAAAASDLHTSLRELHIGEKTSSITDIARPKLTTSSINTGIATKPKKKKASTPVVDSWEDEAENSDNDNDNDDEPSTQGTTSPAVPDSLGTSPAVAEGPLDPPPTPISPQTSQPWGSTTGPTSDRYGNGPTSRSRSTSGAGTGPRTRDPNRRPEKQTAVAGRLIAGALGIRAPKRTEEQKAYDRSVKEQEIKRRNREREEAARAKEQEEKAKAAIWDD